MRNAGEEWTRVATRYAGDPLVAFNLCNEPHDISDSVWRNGGTVTDRSTTFKAAGMAQLYRAVRKQGARNLVFLSGNAWANVPSSMPVRGFNIVNAVHVYRCESALPPACTTPHPTDPTPILNNWLATSATAPIVVTEFGWPSSSDGTYNRNVIRDAESHGWGWAVFAWDGTTGGVFDLLTDNGATLRRRRRVSRCSPLSAPTSCRRRQQHRRLGRGESSSDRPYRTVDIGLCGAPV